MNSSLGEVHFDYRMNLTMRTVTALACARPAQDHIARDPAELRRDRRGASRRALRLLSGRR